MRNKMRRKVKWNFFYFIDQTYQFLHTRMNSLSNAFPFIRLYDVQAVSNRILCMTSHNCSPSRYRSWWWQERTSWKLLYSEYSCIVSLGLHPIAIVVSFVFGDCKTIVQYVFQTLRLFLINQSKINLLEASLKVANIAILTSNLFSNRWRHLWS